MISSLMTVLLNNGNVTALVGQKIFPVRAKQDTPRPYIIVRRSANIPIECKTAPSTEDKPQFNLVVYADSYSKAEEISNVVRGLLDGYNTTPFKNVWYTTAEDLFDPTDGNDGSVVINNYYRAWVTQTIT